MRPTNKTCRREIPSTKQTWRQAHSTTARVPACRETTNKARNLGRFMPSWLYWSLLWESYVVSFLQSHKRAPLAICKEQQPITGHDVRNTMTEKTIVAACGELVYIYVDSHMSFTRISVQTSGTSGAGGQLYDPKSKLELISWSSYVKCQRPSKALTF